MLLSTIRPRPKTYEPSQCGPPVWQNCVLVQATSATAARATHPLLGLGSANSICLHTCAWKELFTKRQLCKERGQSKGTCITYQEGFLDPRNHRESSGREQGLTPHMMQFLTAVIQALEGKELGIGSERGLTKLSEALYHQLSGSLATCRDTLTQRSKAIELT